MSFMQANTPDTVVHRSSPMRLLSPIAFDGGTVQLTSEASPVSSGEASVSSGQSSNALRGDLSTAKTSLDSRFSLFGRVLSGQSSENRKMPWKALGDGDIDLQSIQEASILAPKPKPTAITVEKATAAKIFFETYYNDLLFRKTSPRSMRRRQLEGLLYNDVNASVADKDEQRRLWALRESEYLRELRVMKSRPHIPECPDRMVSDYEVVKVVGKGSFGVVRLVREKEYAE
ncbi:MAG: hypothetical protein M1818_001615 [Claussenomyces sp. TS43310]|nr:MAG: hypothetical protein M1818_001615 [Claussenomyces sp. TS43310]